MTAPARLLSVRLQGFKSFAERTHVTFGPGISAVVGPNGSGKSNLADALRWALGEQGRALRTRRAEDVVWAGSERRPALGMADVQLTLDNADGLLPVEFAVVELGRRLYRSGENEYLLNRQRVRLRDLVDLLDAAHLAENAFLFIGQGMVDQALALRPEERRPLFEEVAGVRRHDRRRRRAEEQLVETEANLTRVLDVLAELRPQVRRLAAQAEQQRSRRDAGLELADALITSAHARWHAAAARRSGAEAALAETRATIEAARAELADRERLAAGITDRLAATAAAVDEARRALDEAREVATTARLEAAAAEADAAALTTEADRLSAERDSAAGALERDRRLLAITAPGPDPVLEHDAREAERALDVAVRELADARGASVAASAQRDAAIRAVTARAADLDLARRRLGELQHDLDAATNAAARATEARDTASRDLEQARLVADAIRSRESAAWAAEETAAATLAETQQSRAAAAEELARVRAALAAATARLQRVRAALEGSGAGPLAELARAAGGRRLDEGLVVDEALRPAVGAALAELAGAFVVPRAGAPRRSDVHGMVIVADWLDRHAGGADGPARAAFLELVSHRGGGPLAPAIRSDPTGAARRLLAAVAWVPDLEAAIELEPSLPAGWAIVTLDGGAVLRGPALRLGADEGPLDRRAEADRLEAEVTDLGARRGTLQALVERHDGEAAATGRGLAEARAERERAEDERRSAEVARTAAERGLEAAGREAAWLEAQRARVAAAVERAAATLGALDGASPAASGTPRDERAAAGPATPDAGGPAAGEASGDETAAAGPGRGHIDLLEARIADLRATRDRVEAAWRASEAQRREAERERSRAEASVAIAERRIAEADSLLVGLAGRRSAADRRRARSAEALAASAAAVSTLEGVLAAATVADAESRSAFGGTERAVGEARDRLRGLEDRARSVEREEVEARLGQEGLREQLLVELAGLGELARRRLADVGRALAPAEGLPGDGPAAEWPASDGPVIEDATSGESDPGGDEVSALEAALAAAGEAWAATPAPDDVPSPGRLGALRRRYHELGAANPFAVEEHASLARRLETLEAQRTDLLGAVERTRRLIAELDALIAGQFRETFGALERAFDARFRQLFGGGFARLTLTEPGDLSTTGVEITARPPGKKPQALAMLSGGERALTAVALLFSMLEVRPVPFCVLDEVDAALDEANVGRFTEALRDLARTTQVVVITHNRGTIETADALYGVTVGDDSTSRVISLRLEEATEIAARVRGAARRLAGDAASPVPPEPREPIVPAGLAARPEEPADLESASELATAGEPAGWMTGELE